MTFKKGDLILVTEVNSVLYPDKPKPEVGRIYTITYVNEFTQVVEPYGNIAHVEGVHPTPLLEELA